MKLVPPSKLSKIIAGLLAAVMLATLGGPAVGVSALSDDQLHALSLGIHYFNTEEGSISLCGNSSIPLVGNDNAQKIFNYFVAKGLTPYQSAGIVGNITVESESTYSPEIYQGDSQLHSYPPGDLGWGIVQWTPPSKILNYAETVNRPPNDLGTQLDFIWAQLNGTAPNSNEKAAGDALKATTTVEEAAVSFLVHYERAKDHSPTGRNAKIRTQDAQEILARYGGAASGVATTGADSGTCPSGAATGDIVQTALHYAWPDRGHGPNQADAKSSYQTDMPKYNGSTGDQPFSDCGVFVATVMRASGADPNYPKRGTPVQMSYLEAQTSKYQAIPGVTSTAQLQPGDILINSQHTYIYVGQQTGGYNSVSASLHDHVPEASNFYGGFEVFRPIINGDSQDGQS